MTSAIGEARRPRGDDTKAKLLRATQQVVCASGLAGSSARAIAARAGVNQALVFYHFGTVSELIEAASNTAVDGAIDHYQPALAAAATLSDLTSIARRLQEHEREIGNVTFMAQILSGASHDPTLARAARYATSAWAREVRAALHRVLAHNPIAGIVDINGLAHLVTAAFVGLELYADADSADAAQAVHTLDALANVIDTLDSLGPIAKRAVCAAAGKLG